MCTNRSGLPKPGAQRLRTKITPCDICLRVDPRTFFRRVYTPDDFSFTKIMARMNGCTDDHRLSTVSIIIAFAYIHTSAAHAACSGARDEPPLSPWRLPAFWPRSSRPLRDSAWCAPRPDESPWGAASWRRSLPLLGGSRWVRRYPMRGIYVVRGLPHVVRQQRLGGSNTTWHSAFTVTIYVGGVHRPWRTLCENCIRE